MNNEISDSGENTGAADPGVVVDEQPIVEATEKEPETVPVSVVQSIRREKQQLQDQLKMMQDHVSLIQSNQEKPSSKKEDTPQLLDDDVVTFGEAKKIFGKIEQNYRSSVEEIKIQQEKPDYQEVINKYLPGVIAENPDLKATLLNDPNRYRLAYVLAKNSESYRADSQAKKVSADAQRIVDNGKKTGSLSSVGSNAPHSQSNVYKNMSDEDFMKVVNKNRGYY